MVLIFFLKKRPYVFFLCLFFFLYTSCSLRHESLNPKKSTIFAEIDSLQSVADSYKFRSLDSMQLLADQTLLLSKQNDYSAGIIRSLIQKGAVSFYKGNEDTTLILLKKANNLLVKQPSTKKNELLTAQKNSLKGSVYRNRAHYDSAAVFMYNAIEIFEKYDEKNKIASTSGNLATNYIMTEDFKNAMLFTEKAANIFKEIDNIEGLSAVYERKGSIYANQEIYDSALIFFEQSLELAKQINHSPLTINGLHNIGSVYIEQDKSEIGISYLEQATEMYRSMNNVLGLTIGLNNLGIIHYKQGNTEKSLALYSESNQLAANNGLLDLEEESHQQLSRIYEKKQSYQKALFHSQKSRLLSDSLKKLNKNSIIQQLETEYVTTQKDKIILAEKLKNKESQSQRRLIVLISMILISVLTFGVRNRYIENLRLKEKNKWNEKQQKELKHRTENHLEQLSDLFEIYGFYKNKDNELLKEAKNRVNAINLLYHSLSKSKDNLIDIQMFIHSLVDNILKVYGKTSDEIRLNIQVVKEDIDANTSQAIGQIINEILNNSLQHAFSKTNHFPEISIDMVKKEKNNFELTLSDNGIGFDVDIINQHSMGFSLIQAFVKNINGKIMTISNTSGTKYIITFEV